MVSDKQSAAKKVLSDCETLQAWANEHWSEAPEVAKMFHDIISVQNISVQNEPRASFKHRWYSKGNNHIKSMIEGCFQIALHIHTNKLYEPENREVLEAIKSLHQWADKQHIKGTVGEKIGRLGTYLQKMEFSEQSMAKRHASLHNYEELESTRTFRERQEREGWFDDSPSIDR